MSTVVPKLLYSHTKHIDIPVWEITTPTGSKIYYERVHHVGLRPIGLSESCKFGKSTLNVCDVVKTVGNHMPKVLRAKDGYVAPMSWYEKDTLYDGPATSVIQITDDEGVPDIPEEDYSSDYDDYEY